MSTAERNMVKEAGFAVERLSAFLAEEVDDLVVKPPLPDAAGLIEILDKPGVRDKALEMLIRELPEDLSAVADETLMEGLTNEAAHKLAAPLHGRTFRRERLRVYCHMYDYAVKTMAAVLGVSAPGKQRSSVAFRVILAPTDQIVVVPSLPDAQPDPDQPPPDKTKPVLALASLGIGALGIVTGATFGVLAITRDDGDPAIKDDATIATIAFVSGVAFAAAGGVLLWTSHTKGGGLAPAKVRAFLAPRPNGVTLGGSF